MPAVPGPAVKVRASAAGTAFERKAIERQRRFTDPAWTEGREKEYHETEAAIGQFILSNPSLCRRAVDSEE